MTKSKQTREQWLDKHDILDEEVREQTLSNFETRDELQAYITKMQRPGFAFGDPFDLEDLLGLPHALGQPPKVLMEWHKAVVSKHRLIDVFGHPRGSDKAEHETAVLRKDLNACISLGVPVDYVEKHPGRNLRWKVADILHAWKMGIGQDAVLAVAMVCGYPFPEARVTMANALLFEKAGLTSEYTAQLPETFPLEFVVPLFAAGANASAVSRRFATDPSVSAEKILSEIASASAEYWNLIN